MGSFCGTALNEYLLAQFIATIVQLGNGGALNNGYALTAAQVHFCVLYSMSLATF